jgi:hypothetical protein
MTELTVVQFLITGLVEAINRGELADHNQTQWCCEHDSTKDLCDWIREEGGDRGGCRIYTAIVVPVVEAKP